MFEPKTLAAKSSAPQFPTPEPLKPQKSVFKYPSEDETYIRRLGTALLLKWNGLPGEIQDRLLAEANIVWDREYNIPGLSAKLEAFVKRARTRG